jgi:hypothetical protein
LFSIDLSAHFDAERLAQHLLEGGDVAGRCPELELGVGRRLHLQHRVVAAVVKVEADD